MGASGKEGELWKKERKSQRDDGYCPSNAIRTDEGSETQR